MVQIRPLGSSGLKTPRLVLGGNVFNNTVRGDEAFAVLDRFMAAGGMMIDTADVYSAWIPGHKGGESETLLGEWMTSRGNREDVLIATKVGMLAGEGGAKLEPARIAAAIEASLARLQTDYVDLYYAHQDDRDTPLEESLRAFDALVKAGKARAIGASNYSATRLKEALGISDRNGLARYSVLQPHYNLMERDDFEGEPEALCMAEHLGVLPYFGLASGFLTGKYRSKDDLGKSTRGDRVAGYLGERGDRVLAALDAVADETGSTPAQVALSWLTAQEGVTAPIASATSVAQLDELVGAMTLELSAEQVQRLTEASC